MCTKQTQSSRRITSIGSLEQAHVWHAAAVQALEDNNNDIVNAIVDLTM
jgi:hypothetical protein